MKIHLLALLFIFTSCLKTEMGPEAALEDFVESRIGQIISKDFILDRVTGRMLQSFENMSDEDFTKFADMRNIKKDSFKILSKSCQEKKCFITYSISYLTNNAGKHEFSSEVKKIADMSLIDGKWLIADVSNIKTYHESLEPINPLE